MHAKSLTVSNFSDLGISDRDHIPDDWHTFIVPMVLKLDTLLKILFYWNEDNVRIPKMFLVPKSEKLSLSLTYKPIKLPNQSKKTLQVFPILISNAITYVGMFDQAAFRPALQDNFNSKVRHIDKLRWANLERYRSTFFLNGFNTVQLERKGITYFY